MTPVRTKQTGEHKLKGHGDPTRIVETKRKIKEIDTLAVSDPDGGNANTRMGTGPPDYTSIVPVAYGGPGSEAPAEGDPDADIYYIAEDMGTVSGVVPKKVSGDTGGTNCHGLPHTFTDESSVSRVSDTLNRFPSAPNVEPKEECRGEHEIRRIEEPPCVPVANVGTISYSNASHGSNLYYETEVPPKVPVYVTKTVAVFLGGGASLIKGAPRPVSRQVTLK